MGQLERDDRHEPERDTRHERHEGLDRDDRHEGRTATSTGPHVDRSGRSEERSTPGSDRLLHDDERGDLRERWDALQGRFVDDPSEATRLADDLLRDTRDRVQKRWQERHRELTDRWKDRDDLDTEDLRTTLRRYRDDFERLLST